MVATKFGTLPTSMLSARPQSSAPLFVVRRGGQAHGGMSSWKNSAMQTVGRAEGTWSSTSQGLNPLGVPSAKSRLSVQWYNHGNNVYNKKSPKDILGQLSLQFTKMVCTQGAWCIRPLRIMPHARKCGEVMVTLALVAYMQWEGLFLGDVESCLESVLAPSAGARLSRGATEPSQPDLPLWTRPPYKFVWTIFTRTCRIIPCKRVSCGVSGFCVGACTSKT